MLVLWSCLFVLSLCQIYFRTIVLNLLLCIDKSNFKQAKTDSL